MLSWYGKLDSWGEIPISSERLICLMCFMQIPLNILHIICLEVSQNIILHYFTLCKYLPKTKKTRKHGWPCATKWTLSLPALWLIVLLPPSLTCQSKPVPDSDSLPHHSSSLSCHASPQLLPFPTSSVTLYMVSHLIFKWKGHPQIRHISVCMSH